MCARRWLGQDEWSWRVVAGQNAAYGGAPHLLPARMWHLASHPPALKA